MGTLVFSFKSKCVFNGSKWPETHFGNYFLPLGCEICHTFFLALTGAQEVTLWSHTVGSQILCLVFEGFL